MRKKFDLPGKHRFVIDDGGKYEIIILAEGAKVEVLGLFSACDVERINVQLNIHHQAPNTTATTTLKGVARDKSNISFTGKIIVDPGAHGVESFLTERVLLLDDTARAETIPELEILADDVSCSHAASISTLDEEQVFYLMSRGLSLNQAKKAIVDGFLSF